MSENLKKWKNLTEYAGNPVIKPIRPEWVIGDPTFIIKDGKWHLFANGLVSGINHFVSSNGKKWKRLRSIDSGIRPHIYEEDGAYYLLYEKFPNILNIFRSNIVLRKSSDLEKWGRPKTILKPTLPWEGRLVQRVGNPCLVKLEDGYRLYYSANTVFLWDCFFREPKYIGVAHSKEIEGPYKKVSQPVIKPSKNHPYRNFGAGAMKVIREDDSWIGFNNGIYKDKYGKSRSAILLLHSDDGINWKDALKHPVIYPTGTGWKSTFVYQLDVKKVNDTYVLFCNARDGWVRGSESIGLFFLLNEGKEAESKLEKIL